MFLRLGMGLTIGSSALRGQCLVQSVAVIQQDLAGFDRAQHVLRAAAVVRLALSELQGDGVAFGVDQGMEFARQAAARMTHATELVVFFGCWRLADAPLCWTSRASGYRRGKPLTPHLESGPRHKPCASD